MTDLDISIILFLASVGAAFYCGMRYGEYKLVKTMMDMMTPDELDELEEIAHKIKRDLESKGIKDVQVHQVDEEDIVEVKHEVVGPAHIFYKNGDTFMCQGNTFETAAEQFAKMIKKHEIGVIKHTDGGTSLIIENKLKGGTEVK
jgi:PHP family Zn ribbon phosphoesterase